MQQARGRVPTTVLTLTLTGLAAESWPAGGHSPRRGRRLGAGATMLAGAAGGGLLVLHVAVTAALALAVGLLLLAALASVRLLPVVALGAHRSS